MRTEFLKFKLNHANNFEDFYPGPNKEFVSELERKLKQNQIVHAFLSGDNNSGKSFILQSAANLVNSQKSSKAIFIDFAISDHKSQLSKLIEYDLICFDNFQKVIGDYNIELDLFLLFDQVKKLNKSILISCDKPLRDLTLLVDDLRSRIASYNQLFLYPLSPLQLADMINARAIKIGIQINEKVATELVKVLPANVGEIDFILKRIFEHACSNNLKINSNYIKNYPEMFDVSLNDTNKLAQ